MVRTRIGFLKRAFLLAALAPTLAAAAAGCRGADPGKDEEVGLTQQALVASALAQPELDLAIPPAGHWWMHDASQQIVDAKIAEGFRLFRLDVASVAPMRFTAAFVKNTGDFARTGTGYQLGMTQTAVDALAADPLRRIVDVSVYVENGQTRYAAVFMGNTGTQAKTWRLVSGAADLWDAWNVAFTGGFRITDIEVSPPTAPTPIYAAVMVKNQGDDARRQVVDEGTIEDANDLVFWAESPPGNFPARIIALDHKGGDKFAYVVEERLPGEPTWWFADLEYRGLPGAPPGSADFIADPADLNQIDNLGTLSTRLNGRFTDLKRYTVGTEERYLAILTDASSFPQRGPAAGTDPTLQKVDDIIQKAMKRYGIQGANLAITQGPRLVHAQAYGYSHLGFGANRAPREFTPETMSRWASVSKSLTAIAILQLIERRFLAPVSSRVLSLDTRPFAEVFTGAPTDPALNNITLRQILQHRTFWPRNRMGGEYVEVADWQNQAAPASGDNPEGDPWRYQNSNYYLLTRVIERVTGQSYTDYCRQNLLAPIGVQRTRITSPRAQMFTVQTPMEAATYDAVTRHLRRFWNTNTFRWELPGPGDSGWILDSSSLFGSASWTGSPVDLLRVMSSADGSVAGPRVLNDFTQVRAGAANGGPVGEYALGFAVGAVGAGVTVVGSGGYLPRQVMTAVSIRSDTIKFALAFTGDTSSGEVQQVRVQTDPYEVDAVLPRAGAASNDVSAALHDLFNRNRLPSVDRWASFGFPAAPGADCTGVPGWTTRSYAAAARVQSAGSLYQCKSAPANQWCGNVGYKPGIDQNWQQAWTRVNVCAIGATGGGMPPAECSVLSEWRVKTYNSGDLVKRGGKIYECKGWPQSGWCGQAGYEPGVAPAWPNAWTEIRPCA